MVLTSQSSRRLLEASRCFLELKKLSGSQGEEQSLSAKSRAERGRDAELTAYEMKEKTHFREGWKGQILNYSNEPSSAADQTQIYMQKKKKNKPKAIFS